MTQAVAQTTAVVNGAGAMEPAASDGQGQQPAMSGRVPEWAALAALHDDGAGWLARLVKLEEAQAELVTTQEALRQEQEAREQDRTLLLELAAAVAQQVQQTRQEPSPAIQAALTRSAQTLFGTSLAATVPERPALAPDVQLVGPLQGSGFQDQQWLLKRDGQFIQVTEVLYRVLEHLDGERTLAEIAAAVTDSTDWMVRADQVRQIVASKLIPAGLIAEADGAAARPEAAGQAQARSPLALSMRMKLLSPRILDPLARMLQVLYAPALLVPLLAAIGVAHWWLYFGHGLNNLKKEK